MSAKRLAIVNDTDDTPEILASEIKAVAEAAKKLLNSRLSKRAVIVLIHDLTKPKISLGDIETVLDKAADLGKFVKR